MDYAVNRLGATASTDRLMRCLAYCGQNCDDEGEGDDHCPKSKHIGRIETAAGACAAPALELWQTIATI